MNEHKLRLALALIVEKKLGPLTALIEAEDLMSQRGMEAVREETRLSNLAGELLSESHAMLLEHYEARKSQSS